MINPLLFDLYMIYIYIYNPPAVKNCAPHYPVDRNPNPKLTLLLSLSQVFDKRSFDKEVLAAKTPEQLNALGFKHLPLLNGIVKCVDVLHMSGDGNS